MSTETALSRWLRDEMPRRGYPLGGPRSGGISRLAADAGLPQATVSRLVNGKAGEPEVETLRKLGKVFDLDIVQMMIHAGLIEYTEVSVGDSGTFTESATVTTREPLQDPGDLGPNVYFGSLDRWEQELLTALRDFPPQVRMRVLAYAQGATGERLPETLLGERRNNDTG